MSALSLVGLALTTVPLSSHRARADPPATPGTISEVDQALARAAETGQSVVIASATSEDVVAYAQPDGHLTAELSSGPVRTPDPSAPDGWTDIDTTLGMGWDAPLPEPTLDGNSATYPAVLPGTDLTIDVQPSGFEVSLIIRTPPTEPMVVDVPLVIGDL